MGEHPRAARAAITLVVLLLQTPMAPAIALPGDLDPSFDGDGKRILVGIKLDYAQPVLVQPDGKIVIAGYSSSGNQDFVLARLNADGLLDGGFDRDGVSLADFSDQDIALAAALQPDGRIVVAGYARSAAMDTDVAVARFNPDGTLDASFDPGGAEGPGKRTIDFGSNETADGVLVQPDGKIVLGGRGGATADLAVTRLNPDGSDDASFDGDGHAAADFGGNDSASAVALQADGKIVLAGSTSLNQDVAVARFNPVGTSDMSLDDTFDANGKRTFDYAGNDHGRDVLVQPDGKLVVAGYGGGNTALAATRLNPDGTFDPGFGERGTSSADFGGLEEGNAALLQTNGKIVLVGETPANNDIAVARLQPSGAPDGTFSSDGKTTIDVAGDDDGYAAALQADGKIVIAGFTDGGAAVVRLEGDPPPERGGGTGPGTGPGRETQIPRCFDKPATIVGTTRRDQLRGTARPDVIAALGGNDRISGAGGADLICGGRGNDRLSRGRGPDHLRGQQGKDTLTGGPGNDRLSGGAHTDRCLGGPGRDRARACEHRRSISHPRAFARSSEHRRVRASDVRARRQRRSQMNASVHVTTPPRLPQTTWGSIADPYADACFRPGKASVSTQSADTIEARPRRSSRGQPRDARIQTNAAACRARSPEPAASARGRRAGEAEPRTFSTAFAEVTSACAVRDPRSAGGTRG